MTDDLDTAPLWFGDYERRLNARLDRLEAEILSLQRDVERLDSKVDSFIIDVIDLKRRARKDAA